MFFHLFQADRPGVVWWDVVDNAEFDLDEVTLGAVTPQAAGVSFEVQSGKRLGDLMGSTALIPLISPKLATLFRQHEFTGWVASEAPASDTRFEAREMPFVLQITGRAENCTRDESKLEVRVPPMGRIPTLPWGTGLSIEGWDGSDLFMVENRRYIFCTDRVRDACVAADLVNVGFEPVTEVGFPLSWTDWVAMGGDPSLVPVDELPDQP